MLNGASDNLGKGWINGESKYSGSTYRLPVALPATGVAVTFFAAIFFTSLLSSLTWDINIFINVPFSKVSDPMTAWKGLTHFIGMQNYDKIYGLILKLPDEYRYELYAHTFGALFISLFPAAAIGWHVGKPRSVIRHISGVKLRTGNDAINYANRMIAKNG